MRRTLLEDAPKVALYNMDPKAITNLGAAPLMVTGTGQSTCVPKVPPPPPPPPK